MNFHARGTADLQAHSPQSESPLLRLCRRAFWIIWMLAAAMPAVQAAQTRLPDAQEARLRQLSRELRCMVCQNESLAESHAPLAADLREEIRTQIREGQSNQEITDYLVARYGDFVTYRPPVNGRTALLWFGPWGVLLCLLLILWSFHKRNRRQHMAPVPEQKARDIQDTYRRLKQQYGDRDE